MGKPKKSKPSENSRKNCRPKSVRGTPRNPFILFVAELRKKMLAKDPTITHTDIMKKAGCCWRKMKDEQKDLYRKKVSSSTGYCPTCKRIMPKKGGK